MNLMYFFSTKTMRITKVHFGHCVGKYDPLVLNYPVTFVPESARCSSALCLFRCVFFVGVL